LPPAVQADIDAGLAMSRAAAGLGVRRPPGRACAEGSWSAADAALKPRSTLPVYGRQLYPEQVLGEAARSRHHPVGKRRGAPVDLPAKDARIGILSFKSKMHAIGDEVLDGVLEAIARAERDLDGLVIWHEAPLPSAPTCSRWPRPARPASSTLEKTVAKFQQASMALKHAMVPTVAAVQGMAGRWLRVRHARQPGCWRWRAMSAWWKPGRADPGRRRLQGVALRARQPGQPAAATCSPSSRTCSRPSPWPTSKERLQAVELGFAASDDIVFNARELLHVALHGPGPGRIRLPAAAGAARRDGGRPQRHRHLRDDADQHEGGRLHLAWDYRVARPRPPPCAAAR
jgi:3-hydroxyacyl-CoA dehydrogenase